MLKRLLMNGEQETNESWITWFRKKPYHLIITILFFINIILITVNAGLWIIAAKQKLFVAADFTAFYTGFYLVRIGESENLYNWAVQTQYQQEFIGDLQFVSGLLPFINPPHVALFFSPLSFAPLGTSFYIWSIIQLGLLIWLIINLIHLFVDWNQNEKILLISGILAFWPLVHNLLFGQFSLLLLIGLVNMFIAMKDSRYTQAGLWLFLLSIKPHLMLIPGMMTLNKRYWQIAITVVITGFVIFAFSWVMIGIKPWLQYIKYILTIREYFDKYVVFPKVEYSFQGVLSNLVGKLQGNIINIISGIVLLLGMIFIWFLWRKGIAQQEPRFTLYFALTILLTVFLSLHLNPYDSLLLVLPIALFYDYLRKRNYPRKAYSIIALICPLVFFIAAFTTYNIFGIIRPPVALIITLTIWMVYYLIKEFRTDNVRNSINDTFFTPP